MANAKSSNTRKSVSRNRRSGNAANSASRKPKKPQPVQLAPRAQERIAADVARGFEGSRKRREAYGARIATDVAQQFAQGRKRSAQFAHGAALAVKMLRELERTKAAALEAYFVDPQDRKGAPQRNIVLERLDELANNREAMEGFASVLSDYVASCASGVIPDADSYPGADHA